jgi:acid phosphatase class B
MTPMDNLIQMEGRNAIVTNLFGQRAYHQRTSTQGGDTVRKPKSDKKKKKDIKSKKERKAYGDSDNDSSNSDEEEISSPAIII